MPLLDGLGAAVALDPWHGLTLIAGKGDGEVDLVGAERLSVWHQDPANGPGKDKHHEQELPVRLIFVEGEALELGPFVRARICRKCDYRDVFLFDALPAHEGDARFDLLDYGRGHKMRQRGREVPDLLEAFKAADPVQRPAQVEGALSSRDVVEALDAARVDRRYRSPGYLRARLAAFLRERPRGVYWLQAPAHVGKTTLVQGLDGFDPEPLIKRDNPAAAAVAAFFCKREYREGAATFVNGLERAIERALDIRADANARKPLAGPVLDAADRAAAFAAWLEEWRDFAQAQHHMVERPRLLIAIDGLDETDPPERTDSLLHLLPRPEQLSDGLYLLLTSRRPQDADCPRWLGPALAGHVGTEPDAATRVVGLDDKGYRSLLRSYAADRIGRVADSSFDALFATILDKAEGRFVYVSFIVERLLRGALPLDRLGALAVGDDLYRSFLDGLDREFHPKLADAIRDVLLVLAAEERAHDWILGEGSQIDRATGGILKPVPELWPGLPLRALARLTAFNTADDGYDGRFVEILLSLQGVLAVSRGDEGVPRYRLGLKGLTGQIKDHAAFAPRLPPVHAALAADALDALDVLADENAGAAEKAAKTDQFAEGAAHALPHIRLSQSEKAADRWDVSRAVAQAQAATKRLEARACYGDAIAWYNLWLWWREGQLPPQPERFDERHAESANNLASTYGRRGLAKHNTAQYAAAELDYRAAIDLMGCLRNDLRARWPVRCRRELAQTYIRRGIVRVDLSALDRNEFVAAAGLCGAISDFNAAIGQLEKLRTELGDRWPIQWSHDLARAQLYRGVAEVEDPEDRYLIGDIANADIPQVLINSIRGVGANAAIADYDRAIGLLEETRAALGKDWPVACLDDLAAAYFNRAVARTCIGDRRGACNDARCGKTIWLDLACRFGEKPWIGLARQAAVLCEQVCRETAEAQPRIGWGHLERIWRALPGEGRADDDDDTSPTHTYG